MKSKYPIYLAGEAVFNPSSLDVFDKFTGDKLASVSVAGADDLDNQIENEPQSSQPHDGPNELESHPEKPEEQLEHNDSDDRERGITNNGANHKILRKLTRPTLLYEARTEPVSAQGS